jgi:hypothetical protein
MCVLVLVRVCVDRLMLTVLGFRDASDTELATLPAAVDWPNLKEL